MNWFGKKGDRLKGTGDRFKVVGGRDAATQPLSPMTCQLSPITHNLSTITLSKGKSRNLFRTGLFILFFASMLFPGARVAVASTNYTAVQTPRISGLRVLPVPAAGGDAGEVRDLQIR
ncbi:MAG: hypothetical protein HZA28_08565 [Candidatus Omnitrophica bacterium]|nr:hypothetical protein [Candidatus Omnitrophota bacterium]